MVKMFPSKSMVEYLSEMNRLFPKGEDDEPFQVNPFHTPYQSTMVNRSSSSADSTSPESYPDFSFRSGDFTPQRPQDLSRSSTESLFTMRRQRAIVGRKILGNTQQMQVSPGERIDLDFNLWQREEPLPETPPESSIEPKNFLYGLLQAENRQLEFKTPVKTNSNVFPDFSPNLSNRTPEQIWGPCLSNRSPSLSNRSQPLANRTPIDRDMFSVSPISTQVSVRSQMSNQSHPRSLLSPSWSNSSQSSLVQRRQSNLSNYTDPMMPSWRSFRASDEINQTKMCTFCRKNGETPVVYMTHQVKEKVGNKNVVTCPILRSHVCATCGATGDDAHTITYCPVLRSSNNGKPLQSTTITLKNTRIKSNGRRRY